MLMLFNWYLQSLSYQTAVINHIIFLKQIKMEITKVMLQLYPFHLQFAFLLFKILCLIHIPRTAEEWTKVADKNDGTFRTNECL